MRKQKLLEIAKGGAERPSKRSKNLAERCFGLALCTYTNRNGRSYDQVFDKQIRALRPEWFVDTKALTKAKLLALASSGGERPIQPTKLADRLSSYTRENSGCYDQEFVAKIRAIRPEWLIPNIDLNKDKLLELAANGAKKPRTTSKLGAAFFRYTNKNINTYDPVFAEKIRATCPDWLVNSKDLKKDKLLELATNGANRPNQCSKNREEKLLGSALSAYTNAKGSKRDPVFNKEIRTLRPDWFEPLVSNKTELLDMAKNGGKRPRGESRDPKERLWAGRLFKYLVDDPSFSEQIHALRPDWFCRTIASTTANKQVLLELAESRDNKPSFVLNDSAEKRLARLFYCYTNENSKAYDPILAEKIRTLRPKWFIHNADLDRSKLLELAKSGAKKPSTFSKDPEEKRLGNTLYRCTTKGADYNSDFNKEIRALRPDWFAYKKRIRRGKYAGRNEYREFLVKALKYYGITSFSGCEFWTLGGREWYEYKHLVDAGIELKCNSYHNVDKGTIDKAPEGACAHSNREFLTIHKLWKRWQNPRVISYDATIGMVESRTEYWQELCYLAIAAAKKSGCILFSWNFLEGYAHSSYEPIAKGVYKQWLQSLKGFAESEGLQIDFYADGQITKRPTSQTPMLAGCCKLVKVGLALKVG